MDNIFYKPILEPEKNYYSDAIISEVIPSLVDGIVSDTPGDDIADLEEKLKNVSSALRSLPGDISTILTDIINKMIEDIPVIGIPVTKEETYDVYNSTDDPVPEDLLFDLSTEEYNNSVSDELPSFFSIGTNISMEVHVPKSLVDMSKLSYQQDSLDLKTDFALKLQNVIQNHLHEMIMVMTDCGVSSISDLTANYDGDAVRIPDSNLQHLSDYIVRSQIIRGQKSRLLKKTHNVDKTVQLMRLWAAAELQRERYYGQTYGDSKTYLSTKNNQLLLESRKMYDSKYRQSMYDMYKYMNSSVIIIDDALKMALKESQAKGVLLKNNVNIFATKASNSMISVSNSADILSSTNNATTSSAATSSSTENKVSSVVSKATNSSG